MTKERDGFCAIRSLNVTPPPHFGTYTTSKLELFYELLTIASRVCRIKYSDKAEKIKYQNKSEEMVLDCHGRRGKLLHLGLLNELRRKVQKAKLLVGMKFR